MNESQIEALLVSAMPLIKNTARVLHAKYQRLGVAWADLYSDGLYGAFLAALTYDPARGTQFTTWAYQYITRYITLGVRFHANETTRGDHGNMLSLDGLRATMTGGVDDLADWDLPDLDAQDPLDVAVDVYVRAAVRRLPPGLRHITYMTFWQDRGPTEIGQVLGMPKSTVRLRQRTALDNLRDSLDGLAA